MQRSLGFLFVVKRILINEVLFFTNSRFDPTIYNMVENQQSESLGRNDSRIQSMFIPPVFSEVVMLPFSI